MERNINKDIAPININRYPGIQDPEERRQAISHNLQEKLARGELQAADTQHNYSGDSVFIKLDDKGEWATDLFSLSR